MRVGSVVECRVVSDFFLEFGEDVGQGLVIVFHFLVVRAALGGPAGADECGHASEDPPKGSLFAGGQTVLVMVDEE